MGTWIGVRSGNKHAKETDKYRAQWLNKRAKRQQLCGLLVSAAGKVERAFHPAVRGRAREFDELEARLAEVGFRSPQHKPDFKRRLGMPAQ